MEVMSHLKSETPTSRLEILELEKKIMYKKRSGIYKIQNIINGNFYIGQSVNLGRRRTNHFYELRHSKHGNEHLQRAFNKYGEENFIFEIILYCEPDELTYYEQSLVDLLKPEYNICRECVDSPRGVVASEETRLKMSLRTSGSMNPMYGKIMSEESRLLMSQANLGKKLSDETRKKMSESRKGDKSAWFGRHHTKEANEKNRIAHEGKKYPKSVGESISKSNQGNKKGKNSSSSFCGVSWNKKSKKWECYISFSNKRFLIGYFPTELEAAIAYNEFALEIYGCKAKLNPISEEEYNNVMINS